MFLVSDELVGSEFSQQIKSLVFGFQEPINWQYSDMTNRMYDNDPISIKTNQVKETFYFSGYIEPTARLYEIVLSFLEKELSHHGVSIGEIFMFRANIFTRKDYSYSGIHHTIHVDNTSDDYMSFLYYIEDSDGDTRFFNEKYSPSMNSTLLSEKQSVSPSGGRYVLFDSNYYHASASPVNHDARSVLNVIFKVA